MGGWRQFCQYPQQCVVTDRHNVMTRPAAGDGLHETCKLSVFDHQASLSTVLPNVGMTLRTRPHTVCIGNRKTCRIAKMSNRHFFLFCDQGKNVKLEKILQFDFFELKNSKGKNQKIKSSNNKKEKLSNPQFKRKKCLMF